MNHPIERDYREANDLVAGKAHDYAEDDNPFSNFEYAAEIAGITVEQVFMVLIAIKTARLGQLVGKGKEPNNESIDDTLLDSMNYPGLMRAYRRVTAENLTVEDAVKAAEDEGYILPTSRVMTTGEGLEAYTFLVGDNVALKHNDNYPGEQLTYIITGFDVEFNRVLCVPTHDWEEALGRDVRSFQPGNLSPLSEAALGTKRSRRDA